MSIRTLIASVKLLQTWKSPETLVTLKPSVHCNSNDVGSTTNSLMQNTLLQDNFVILRPLHVIGSTFNADNVQFSIDQNFWYDDLRSKRLCCLMSFPTIWIFFSNPMLVPFENASLPCWRFQVKNMKIQCKFKSAFVTHFSCLMQGLKKRPSQYRKIVCFLIAVEMCWVDVFHVIKHTLK